MRVHNIYSDLLLGLSKFINQDVLHGRPIKHFQYNTGDSSFQLDYEQGYRLPSMILNLETITPYSNKPYVFQHRSGNVHRIPVLYNHDNNSVLEVQEEEFNINVEMVINCMNHGQALDIQHQLLGYIPINKYMHFYEFMCFLEVDDFLINPWLFNADSDKIDNLFLKQNKYLDRLEYSFGLTIRPLLRFNNIAVQMGSDTNKSTYQVIISIEYLITVPVYLIYPKFDKTKNNLGPEIIKINRKNVDVPVGNYEYQRVNVSSVDINDNFQKQIDVPIKIDNLDSDFKFKEPIKFIGKDDEPVTGTLEGKVLGDIVDLDFESIIDNNVSVGSGNFFHDYETNTITGEIAGYNMNGTLKDIEFSDSNNYGSTNSFGSLEEYNNAVGSEEESEEPEQNTSNSGGVGKRDFSTFNIMSGWFEGTLYDNPVKKEIAIEYTEKKRSKKISSIRAVVPNYIQKELPKSLQKNNIYTAIKDSPIVKSKTKILPSSNIDNPDYIKPWPGDDPLYNSEGKEIALNPLYVDPPIDPEIEEYILNPKKILDPTSTQISKLTVKSKTPPFNELELSLFEEEPIEIMPDGTFNKWFSVPGLDDDNDYHEKFMNRFIFNVPYGVTLYDFLPEGNYEISGKIDLNTGEIIETKFEDRDNPDIELDYNINKINFENIVFNFSPDIGGDGYIDRIHIDMGWNEGSVIALLPKISLGHSMGYEKTIVINELLEVTENINKSNFKFSVNIKSILNLNDPSKMYWKLINTDTKLVTSDLREEVILDIENSTSDRLIFIVPRNFYFKYFTNINKVNPIFLNIGQSPN